MSIASEITRINNNIASAYTAVNSKGGTLPATQNSANLATAISSVPAGVELNTTVNYNTSASDKIIDHLYEGPIELKITSSCTNLYCALQYSKFSDVSFSSQSNSTYVTSINAMFDGSKKLKSVDLSNLRFNKLNTAMAQTFNGCTALESVNFGNCFQTNQMTQMRWTFVGCTSLTSVIFGTVNFSNVSDFSKVFYGCSALQTLDLSMFNPTAPKIFDEMFYNCTSLNHLDIRQMKFSSATSFTNAFTNVPNDCEIIVKDATEKSWFATNWSNLTNVKTVAEYEA